MLNLRSDEYSLINVGLLVLLLCACVQIMDLRIGNFRSNRISNRIGGYDSNSNPISNRIRG